MPASSHVSKPAIVDDELVFRALADSTRRALLDALFATDGQTLTELEARVPELTRFGVMMHLRVLQETGLITKVRVGRFKHHYLNAAAIGVIHERWVNKFVQPAVAAMSDLKRRLEEKPLATTKPQHVVSLCIRTTPEELWQAITDPAFTRQYWHNADSISDFKPGSIWQSVGPAGELYLDGEIVEADPPKRLVHTFHIVHRKEAAADAPTTVTWEIEPDEDGICRLTLTHNGFSSEESPSYRYTEGGWTWIVSGLKTLLETGRPMALAS